MRRFINFMKNPESKYYHFSKYTFLKCIFQNFCAGFLVYLIATNFIRLPVKEILRTLFFPVFFVAIFISAAGYISHTLITKRMDAELAYWKLHKMNKLDSSKLLRKVQIYPLVKGFETFVCFLLCALLTSFFMLKILNVDEKLASIFILFVFLMSYLYGIYILDVTSKDCSTLAVDIVKGGVYLDESKLNYKAYNMLATFIYMILPSVIAMILFIITAKLSFTSVIIHSNGQISCRYLTPLEQQKIFVRCLINKKECLHLMTYISTVSVTAISLIAILHFRSIIEYNKKIQNTLENLINQKSNLAPMNLPVNKYRDVSYTMNLLDKAILIFNKYMENNISINNTIEYSTEKLLNHTKNSVNNAMELKKLILKNSLIMNEINGQPEINAHRINEVVSVSSKMITDIKNSFDDINNNIRVMKEITETNNATIIEISNLSKKITAIWEIVNLIGDISEQTKIIAFNSELEANNIDSSNENFKNVARDIRSLTEKTTNLTNEIKEKMTIILQNARKLINTSSECTSKIQEGNDISIKLKKKFETINEAAISTSKHSKLTQQYMNEQKMYFNQISDGLSEIRNSVDIFQEGNTNLIKTISNLKKNTELIQNTTSSNLFAGENINEKIK